MPSSSSAAATFAVAVIEDCAAGFVNWFVAADTADWAVEDDEMAVGAVTGAAEAAGTPPKRAARFALAASDAASTIAVRETVLAIAEGGTGVFTGSSAAAPSGLDDAPASEAAAAGADAAGADPASGAAVDPDAAAGVCSGAGFGGGGGAFDGGGGGAFDGGGGGGAFDGGGGGLGRGLSSIPPLRVLGSSGRNPWLVV